MSASVVLSLVVLLTGATAPAAAPGGQDRAASGARTEQPRDLRPPPRVPVDFRGYVHFDEVWMSASRSFKAVVGTSSLTAGGVGVDVIDLWRQVFVRAGFSRMGGYGSRVFVEDAEVVPLNVPFAVRVRALELGAGWRFGHPKLPRYTFYGGAGFVRLGFTERSAFARDEDSDEAFRGRTVFGGVEIPVWKRLVAGGEIQFRSVPNALGDGGVSAAFQETGLGGFMIRGLVAIRK